VTPAAVVQAALTALAVRVPFFRFLARQRIRNSIYVSRLFVIHFSENRLDSSIAEKKIDC
jgi:hypothetical protein